MTLGRFRNRRSFLKFLAAVPAVIALFSPVKWLRDPASAMAAVRAYRNSDRAKAIERLGDARVIDQATHSIVTDGDGFAVWRDAGEVAELGAVVNPGGDRKQFYRLVLETANQANDAGFETATFQLYDQRLVDLIERDFNNAEIRVEGTLEGAPAAWRVTVEIADAIAQLQAVIDDR